MYRLDEIQANSEDMRNAVMQARPFKPLYVKMKVVYGCNLKCEMCNHRREKRESPVSAERFKEVIREFREMGTTKIHLSGGEPMLRPQIPAFVELASSVGVKVTMTTNGTLVDKIKAKRLVEGGLRGVKISIDSPIRKMH
jgi:MoaA/NifB/PqqE/SkfB family radical SAM enzyme